MAQIKRISMDVLGMGSLLIAPPLLFVCSSLRLIPLSILLLYILSYVIKCWTINNNKTIVYKLVGLIFFPPLFLVRSY